ncbi:MAG: hypothetical protein ACP5VQ_00190, partial [Phycisphaerae bacterium]
QHAQIISITGRSYRLQRAAVSQPPSVPGSYTSGHKNEDSSPLETGHPLSPREAKMEPGQMPEKQAMEKTIPANKVSEVVP